MADLIEVSRFLSSASSIKPRYEQKQDGQAPIMEIFFSHEVDLWTRRWLMRGSALRSHSGVLDE